MLHWVKELNKKGWQEMLIDRLRFHGGLSVREVSNETGRSIKTVKKHFKFLVDSGKAKWGTTLGDETGQIRIEGIVKWQ